MTNEQGKTTMKRMEQYQDRWSSVGLASGIESISDMLSPSDLRAYDIFEEYPDKFLEKLCPDISVAKWKKGALLFEEGSYINLAFYVVSGEVEVTLAWKEKSNTNLPIFATGQFSPDDQIASSVASGSTLVMDMVSLSKKAARTGAHEITFLATMDFDIPKSSSGVRLGKGELFGEIGAMSGWPQSITAKAATDCTLVQIRVPALRVMKNKSQVLKERLDKLYRERSLFTLLKSTPLFNNCGVPFLERLTDKVELISLGPGEALVNEGDPVDALYLVRSGFIKLAQSLGEGDIVVSYLSKGMTMGEVEILVEGLAGWEANAVSVEYSEIIKVPTEVLQEIIEQDPGIEGQLWKSASARIRETGYSKRNMGHSEFTQTALDRGLVQGNSILVIDLETCTRCDDCVRACAATHGGRPRFVREGNKLGNLLVPKSCYHCRDPVCLVGCPTGAIHRAGVTDVVMIDGEICIGCKTCYNSCPYDSIVMHDMEQKWPDDMLPAGLRGMDRLQASKCDLCSSTEHGPACVRNCPQGCANRVSSLAEFEQVFKGE
jgi:CRP-like cAMP-binding protein/Fe-S-cluster-containing hydrogenase component 2